MATAKLTDKQIEALRIANKNDIIDTREAHPAVLLSLVKRGYLRDIGWLGMRKCYEPTDAAIEVMEALDDRIPEPMPQFPDPEPVQIISLTIDPTAEGVEGATGVPNYNVGVIPEPDHSDDDTKPLEPVNVPVPVPNDDEMMETWASIRPPKPEEDVKPLYKRAYRWERYGAERVYAPDDLDDIPADVAIAAHQSYVASKIQPDEPFIMRVWKKRMRDALDAIPRVLPGEDRLFENLVLDYRIAKGCYLKCQERYQLRQAAGARR